MSLDFCKVSLIKTGLMFHKYHLLNQLQVFMRYKKITKMSFNIPLNKSELLLTFYVVLVEWTDKLILDPVNVP